MVHICETCGLRYNDEYQWTLCPHNPLEAGPGAEAYCRRHDLFGPCPLCARIAVSTEVVETKQGEVDGFEQLVQASKAFFVQMKKDLDAIFFPDRTAVEADNVRRLESPEESENTDGPAERLDRAL